MNACDQCNPAIPIPISQCNIPHQQLLHSQSRKKASICIVLQAISCFGTNVCRERRDAIVLMLRLLIKIAWHARLRRELLLAMRRSTAHNTDVMRRSQDFGSSVCCMRIASRAGVPGRQPPQLGSPPQPAAATAQHTAAPRGWPSLPSTFAPLRLAERQPCS